MYDELIRKINPAPKFNLEWYKNEDLYSEGEIEDIIIGMIAENEPEQYVEAIASKYNWSTYYHLTHTRKNILNWYPFKPNASVLEIGCGMGAITSVLCDKCQEVTAVELSQKRAIGTLLRCREKENLEIIVGNLNDIVFEKKFDYITLIGVLEYQGSYTDTNNPYLDFLKKIKSLLKPDGKLLIAIENQYGLKYWCGAREDHTGIPFDGMNQYSLSEKKVRTFSKEALDSLVKDSGFEKTFFYYPMPDYKLPSVIYSEKCLPKNGNMLNMQYYYIPDGTTLVAQESKIYEDVIKNNVFEFFANSFLVECSVEGVVGEVTFASLSSKRFPEYQIGTRFRDNSKVEKFALYSVVGNQHIRQIRENEIELGKRNVEVLNSVPVEYGLETDFLDYQTLEEVLLELYKGKEVEKIYKILDCVYEQILQSSVEVDWSDNIMYTFDLNILPDENKYGVILKTGYLDMILRNAFMQDDKIIWFDQEWTLENVPAKFVMYRLLVQFYSSYEFVNKVLPISVVAQKYDLLMSWKDFQDLESLFMSVVIDTTHLAECNGFSGNYEMACRSSINRILSN